MTSYQLQAMDDYQLVQVFESTVAAAVTSDLARMDLTLIKNELHRRLDS